jgi:lysophospholipase L1-like esterase
MQRFFVLLVVVALLLIGGGWYIGRSGAEVEPYTIVGPGDVYLALGDSLAAGFTVGDPPDAYVKRIAAHIRGFQPIELRNLAVPGETSRSMLQRQLPQALDLIQEERAAGKRVSPITIDIGGNDVMAVRDASDEVLRSTIQGVEANIASMLDQLITATTDQTGERTADIAIMTYYNPYPGDAQDETSPAYWSQQLNEAIKRAAEARGVAVADIEPDFAGGNVYRYTYITLGDIHANADGHALIAERFVEALGYNTLHYSGEQYSSNAIKND